MRVEFTKHLTGEPPFRDIGIALNERADNLLFESMSNNKKQLLEKVKTRPDLVFRCEEFQFLHEMAALTKKKWLPNKTLKVYFFGGQDARTQRVLEYASIWSKHCSIKFQATTKMEEAQIRVAFKAPSSWSYIGTDALGVKRNEPTINFGWLDDQLPEIDYIQVVLHEFGHVLGLIHEHQSPVTKINWNKDIVYNYFREYHNWTKTDVDKNLFQEFEKTSTQYYALDKASIMGYHIPPIFTTDMQEFPKNYVLSDMDKHYIGQIYP